PPRPGPVAFREAVATHLERRARVFGPHARESADGSLGDKTAILGEIARGNRRSFDSVGPESGPTPLKMTESLCC
ncbi:MAG TPA: hypothetical protein VGD64_02785, partial [Acidisarcina sp.]